MDTPHPSAVHHMPWFITAPGETDGLFVGTIIFLIIVILAVGNFYFQLHALPEHMAHRTNKAQLQVVAVLTLLALFTHNHVFWIAALLLALVQLPDFSTPMESIALSLERLAGRVRPVAPAEPTTELVLAANPPALPEPQASSEPPPPAASPPPAPKPSRKAKPALERT